MQLALLGLVRLGCVPLEGDDRVETYSSLDIQRAEKKDVGQQRLKKKLVDYLASNATMNQMRK